MNNLTKTQVDEIVKQVTVERVERFEYRTGHETDHCFVTLTSGKPLVIRFGRVTRDESERECWTIERFAREDRAGELYAEGTGLATPRTLFIDGTRTIVDSLYAIQTLVPGKVFRHVFRTATADEKVKLLRCYGEVARKIHTIEVPPFEFDQIHQHLVHLACSPIRARCSTDQMDTVIDRLDAKFIGSADGAECLLRRTSFYRAVFTSNSTEAFLDSIACGIQILRDGKKITGQTATSLSALFERHKEAISCHLDRRNFCHGDYHFSNIMVDRDKVSSDWKIVGLFDLDIAQVTCPIEDFGKVEEFDFPYIQVPKFRRHVLEGYGRELSYLEYSLLILGSLLKDPDRFDRILPLIGEATQVNEDTLVQALFEA